MALKNIIDICKRTLQTIASAKDLAKGLYWKLFPPIHSPSYWINKIIKNEDLNIVQIGSNDGKRGDPFFKLIQKNKNWKVLFVEPVPYLFERLKDNFVAESRFTFENVAINDGSRQIFYWVKEEANQTVKTLPAGYDQLGSFYRNNIVKHLEGKLEPYIVESEMQGMTLKELFTKNNITSLDVLHIDTEGYDWKILSQLDLYNHLPLLILFEHINLQQEEREQAITFLKELYYIFQLGGDFLCIRKDNLELLKKDFYLLQKKLIHKS